MNVPPHCLTESVAKTAIIVICSWAWISEAPVQAQGQNQAVPAAQIPGPERREELRRELQFLQSSDADASAVRELIAIDGELRGATQATERDLQKTVLIALARRPTDAAMEHLRSVFETQTSRRHDAAYAISLVALDRPQNDQDWRYLVRSLPIMEGKQAVSVMQALRRFRRRATRPVWIREVILIGLRLSPADQASAVHLLQHWTLHNVTADNPKAQLQEYQDWFRREYPHEPDPDFPTDPEGAKYTLQNLLPTVNDLPSDAETLAAGEAVFVRATCRKCHRRGDTAGQPADNRFGPDLTSLGWRRQPQEILTAILYPSHRLNDEYPVTTVVLQTGTSVSGLMMPAENRQLKIVASDGKETIFAAAQIAETMPSRISSMPAGLLEPLPHQEVVQLLAWLVAPVGSYEPHRNVE